MAFDGCSSLKAPDQPRIRALLGKARHRWGMAGYPALQLMALCETGTRGLLGAVFGPTNSGEVAYATRLLPLLSPSMLLLADRGFDSKDFLADVADTGAQFLVRLRSQRCPAVLAVLPDGSYLTRLGRLKVRIIEADITVTTRDRQRVGDRYRLATTLLGHRSDPAMALVRLYSERWEIESAFYSLRHTLLTGRVLRSCDPFGLEQELWALLALYQILRRAMVEAVESVPGTDPDRASFTVALEAARDQVTTARRILPPDSGTTAQGSITDAVISALLPPRRPRVSARKVKSPMTRYPGVATDPRPAASQDITHLAIAVHQAVMTPPPAPRAPGRRALLLRLLRTDPHRTWQCREIADGISCSNIRSLWTQLRDWTKEGILHKVARGTYELTPEWLDANPSAGSV